MHFVTGGAYAPYVLCSSTAFLLYFSGLWSLFATATHNSLQIKLYGIVVYQSFKDSSMTTDSTDIGLRLLSKDCVERCSSRWHWHVLYIIYGKSAPSIRCHARWRQYCIATGYVFAADRPTHRCSYQQTYNYTAAFVVMIMILHCCRVHPLLSRAPTNAADTMAQYCHNHLVAAYKRRRVQFTRKSVVQHSRHITYNRSKQSPATHLYSRPN